MHKLMGGRKDNSMFWKVTVTFSILNVMCLLCPLFLNLFLDFLASIFAFFFAFCFLCGIWTVWDLCLKQT